MMPTLITWTLVMNNSRTETLRMVRIHMVMGKLFSVLLVCWQGVNSFCFYTDRMVVKVTISTVTVKLLVS